MDPMKRLRTIRECGSVKRYHTYPIIGDNSVGHHQWNVAMLILQLHPAPRTNLIAAALTHDLGERWTGDLPAPIKLQLSAACLAEIEAAEVRGQEQLGLAPDLTADELMWLKACDTFECYIFASEQIEGLGNVYVAEIQANAARYIREGYKAKRVPLPVWEAFEAYEFKKESVQ
jgi:5'-deoxynucleotidase YfbR-like HD superfamily hydrolase